jgi:hypothetical protein
MVDYRKYYGYGVVTPTIIVRLSIQERIERAFVNRNYKLLFVKQIRVPIISVSTNNVTT